jgi:hypothetical protein
MAEKPLSRAVEKAPSSNLNEADLEQAAARR